MAASKSRRLKASITSRTAWTFSFDIQLQYRVTAVSDTAPLLLCARRDSPGRLQGSLSHPWGSSTLSGAGAVMPRVSEPRERRSVVDGIAKAVVACKQL